MSDTGRKPQVSQYGSVDPAPPAKASALASLKEQLCDEEQPMFQRMRAVSRPNQRTDEAFGPLSWILQ